MENIWIIGAGNIAQEYSKILKELDYSYTIIGRGENNAKAFAKANNHDVIIGGLDNYILSSPPVPKYAIVATDLGSLSENCITLMKYGVKNILCEKPGFQYPIELKKVLNEVNEFKSNIFYAYNRRFYASVRKVEEIIKEDGGITSFNFEFTEWSHVIEKLNKPKDNLNNWFYANSTHVIDLAFFLGGNIVQINSFTSGELTWHKPVVFSGAGITDKGALFNYAANWAAPGRWGIEILTAKHRLYLKPIEQLQIQNIGSVLVSPVEIDDYYDKKFKPGFYQETKAFLEGDYSRLCSFKEQFYHIENIYEKIIGRKD